MLTQRGARKGQEDVVDRRPLRFTHRFHARERQADGGIAALARGRARHFELGGRRALVLERFERRERFLAPRRLFRSEEHTSELQSLMRISYAVFCLKKKTKENANTCFNMTTNL